ncbi:hypothetical protein BGX29_008832 [Mortierella sp. GBA35]|nr:hypothetical protein BGX29_008832 [Mortierella sp. GBA35]
MSTDSKPTILIVGAGLGGVMLGALLEKASIPYLIVERATTIKPLDMRPYMLIPAHKVHFGKRVETIVEENDKVKVLTANGEIFEGDILVGADGAYSNVRQGLYERLKKEGRLPLTDQEELPFHCTCLVGQTVPLGLEKFPTAQNTICWMVLHHLDSTTNKAVEEERARNSENSEWGPNAAQVMCDRTRNFPISFGDSTMTLADMYDQTPKDLISKVILEEKIFETWSAGRTVLLGDACHKLNLAGGQGAFTATQDALALANLFYALPSNTNAEIEKTFSEYRAERYPAAVEAFSASQMLSKLMGKNFVSKEIEPRGTVVAVEPPSAVKARAIYHERKGSAAV